jgi:hypothetical protein
MIYSQDVYICIESNTAENSKFESLATLNK